MRAASRAAATACALALAVASLLSGCDMARPRSAPTAPLDGLAGEVETDLPERFRRFVLNAVLLPLLDVDAQPARWQDPALAIACGPATRVAVDGGPVPVGAAWHGRSFTVHWTMDGCMPFGADGPALDGRVDLIVFAENEGLSAIVRVSDGHPFVVEANWTM